jgi:hypothetical protein
MRNPKRWAIINAIFALLLGIPATLFIIAATKVSGDCADDYRVRTNSIVTVCHPGSTARHYALAALTVTLYVAIVTVVAACTWSWDSWATRMDLMSANDRIQSQDNTIYAMQNYQDDLTNTLKDVVDYLNNSSKTAKQTRELRDKITKVGVDATRQSP